MQSSITLVMVLFGAVLPFSSAQEEQYLRTYVLSANQKVFQKLFGSHDARMLSTIPLCFSQYVNETDDGSTKMSDMSGEDYALMMEANNQSAVSVEMYLEILQLIDLSEKSQTVNLIIASHKYWEDCRLRWTDNDSSLDLLAISPSMFRKMNIFTPGVRLLEALNPRENAESETQITIYRNGYVWITEEYSTLFSCNIDVSMYPFDIQQCTLTFESVLAEDLVDIQFAHGDVDYISKLFVGRYTPSDQWSLTVLPPVLSRRNTCMRKSEESSCWNDGLKYTLILRRNPNYQLTNLLFPAFLIVVISSCVFIVPPDGGDKMGLSVSILLSLYMFSQLMYDKMPETGSFPLLSQYFLVCIGLVTASCLYSSISAVFATASPSLPPYVCRFVVAFGPYFIFDLLKSKSKSKRSSAKRSRHTERDALETENNGLQRDDLDAQNKENEQQSEGFNLEEPDTLTWAALGALLDRLFFVLHLAASVAVMVMYLLQGYAPWTGYSSLNPSDLQLNYLCTQLRMQNVSLYDLPCPTAS